MRAALLGLGIVVGVTLAACGGGRGTGDLAAEGEVLYRGEATCATCHGPDLGGTSMGPSLLEPRYRADVLGDDAIRAAIRAGVRTQSRGLGVMPALTHLDDDDIDAVIAFVRSRQGE